MTQILILVDANGVTPPQPIVMAVGTTAIAAAKAALDATGAYAGQPAILAGGPADTRTVNFTGVNVPAVGSVVQVDDNYWKAV